MRWTWLVAGVLVAGGCGGSSVEPTDPAPESPPETSPATLPFEAAELRGLCEDLHADFAEGEPSPFSTPEAAAANLQRESSILDGLEVVDGTISLRGEVVGTFEVIERPDGTFAVESAEWCYPDPEG